MCSYFKLPEDFDTDKEYNDYLEEVEDIVFNLVHDVDVQSTSAKLEAFRLGNREALERSLARHAHEQRQAEAAAAQTQAQRALKLQQLDQEEATQAAELSNLKRNLIDELVKLHTCYIY